MSDIYLLKELNQRAVKKKKKKMNIYQTPLFG
jgi:hypothetical protein